MNNAAVLDRNHLLEVTDGDVEFEQELLSTFRASARVTLARLRAALETGELAQVIREAHLLKGASLNVGANAIGECAGAIEKAARAGDLASVRHEARQLDAHEAALWAELDRL
jgi:HPt (histidine-containing phosphotransfer) domain-containing protein